MRLFLDNHQFISVIDAQDTGYSCQVMELIHGNGIYNADFHEDQSDVVSSIVHSGFTETSKHCRNIAEVFKFHETLMKEIYTPID